MELYTHGAIIASVFSDGGDRKAVYDFFPQYWDEEERDELWKQQMTDRFMHVVEQTNKHFALTKHEDT